MKNPQSAQLAEPRTAAAIAADLETTKAERAQAEADLAALNNCRPGLLATAGDAELDEHDRATARAVRAIDRAIARIDMLQGECDAAAATEEAARRRDAYRRGVEAAHEYKRLAEAEYAPSAQKIVYVLKKMRELKKLADEGSRYREIGEESIYVEKIGGRFEHDPKHWPRRPLFETVELPGAREDDPDFWRIGQEGRQ